SSKTVPVMVPCSTWAPAAPARARTTATAKRARTTPLHMEASVMDGVNWHHHGRIAPPGSRDQSRPRQTDFGRGRTLQVGDAALERGDHGLGPVAHAQLAQDVRDMALDGGLRDGEV